MYFLYNINKITADFFPGSRWIQWAAYQFSYKLYFPSKGLKFYGLRHDTRAHDGILCIPKPPQNMSA